MSRTQRNFVVEQNFYTKFRGLVLNSNYTTTVISSDVRLSEVFYIK